MKFVAADDRSMKTKVLENSTYSARERKRARRLTTVIEDRREEKPATPHWISSPNIASIVYIEGQRARKSTDDSSAAELEKPTWKSWRDINILTAEVVIIVVTLNAVVDGCCCAWRTEVAWRNMGIARR